MIYEIQPVNMTFGATTNVLTQIEMFITYQSGMSQMPVPYNLATAEGVIYWSGQAMIDQMELDNWGTDDMFIVNLVCNQAGVTLA